MEKLSVYHKGQQLLAGDLESGNNLLHALNITLDPEHQARKRKLDFPITPRKDSKIPVGNAR